MNKRLHSSSPYYLVLVVAVALQSCAWTTHSVFPYLEEHQRLEATGEDAQAKILSVTQTGSYINDQPEIELELLIAPNDGEPYRGRTSLICPLIMIPQYQPGNMVAVKIDAARKLATVKGSYQRTPGL